MEITAIATIIEDCIDELALEFIRRPFNFYTETDMHLQLYTILKSKFVFQYVTSEGEQLNLIHTEFPTFSRYRVDDQHFFHLDPSGVRGAYDLVIWDPTSLPIVMHNLAVWRPRFGEKTRPCLIAAIECKLYEGLGRYKAHVHNDLLKLSEPKHLVKHKYMIQFVRNMIYGKATERYFDKLRKELQRGLKSRDVRVKYAEVRKDAEPIDEWI